jgi:hypothetical protein
MHEMRLARAQYFVRAAPSMIFWLISLNEIRLKNEGFRVHSEDKISTVIITHVQNLVAALT